jgi:hypothetical protein
MIVTMKKLTSIVLLSICATLTGCLVPEKFVASVTLKPDASYIYKYDGTAAFAMALLAIRDKGSLPAKDEAGLRADAEKSKKNPLFKKFDYVGQGRYELVLDEQVAEGNQPTQMKFFSVIKDKDSVYSITQLPIKPNDAAQLKTLGVNVNGKFDVVLPSDFVVLSHNAKSAPGVFSKAYSWDIKAVETPVTIKFKRK